MVALVAARRSVNFAIFCGHFILFNPTDSSSVFIPGEELPELTTDKTG